MKIKSIIIVMILVATAFCSCSKGNGSGVKGHLSEEDAINARKCDICQASKPCGVHEMDGYYYSICSDCSDKFRLEIERIYYNRFLSAIKNVLEDNSVQDFCKEKEISIDYGYGLSFQYEEKYPGGSIIHYFSLSDTDNPFIVKLANLLGEDKDKYRLNKDLEKLYLNLNIKYNSGLNILVKDGKLASYDGMGSSEFWLEDIDKTLGSKNTKSASKDDASSNISVVDNNTKIEELKTLFKNVKEGDYIRFGKYEQDNNLNNGKEDIEWVVGSVLADEHSSGKYITLVSRYALDTVQFSVKSSTETQWIDSNVRKWLNNDFYLEAFDDAEKLYINKKSNYYSGDYPCIISDNVRLFCLLLNHYGITSVKATDYAKSHGLYTDSNDNCYVMSSDIDHDGYIGEKGFVGIYNYPLYKDYNDNFKSAYMDPTTKGVGIVPELTIFTNFDQDKASKVSYEGFDQYNVGDIIKYGKFEQDNTTLNGTEDIEWYIVDRGEREFVLLSVKAVYTD